MEGHTKGEQNAQETRGIFPPSLKARQEKEERIKKKEKEK